MLLKTFCILILIYYKYFALAINKIIIVLISGEDIFEGLNAPFAITNSWTSEAIKFALVK